MLHRNPNSKNPPCPEKFDELENLKLELVTNLIVTQL